MKIQVFFGCFLLLLWGADSFAQADNCTDAIQICPQQIYNYTNSGATTEPGINQADGVSPGGFACFDIDNSVWLTFTTNHNGGDITLEFSNINCSSLPGFDQELQAVVISATMPCNASTYNVVSNCVSNGSNDFSLIATGLNPNQQYWIIVDGDLNGVGITNAAECGFDVSITGPGISADAGPDQVIDEGTSTQLQATGGGSYTWNPGATLNNTNIANPTASPEQTTTYFVSVTSNGCTTVDDVLIEVLPIINIPNTITPNGDGFNDTWVIGRINEYPRSELTVFNRWGQEVFHQLGHGSQTNWDGKVNGNSLPSATYYYVLDLDVADDNSPIYKGSLTIVY